MENEPSRPVRHDTLHGSRFASLKSEQSRCGRISSSVQILRPRRSVDKRARPKRWVAGSTSAVGATHSEWQRPELILTARRSARSSASTRLEEFHRLGHAIAVEGAGCSPAQAENAWRRTVFLQYAPRLLLAELAGRPSGEKPFCRLLEGVVLFVDIVGSTALTDEFARRGSDGAERLAAILNRYFGRVIEIAAGFDGDTIRIDGDAAVILWHQNGSDNDRKRLVLAAAAAALALQAEFRDWEPAAGVSLQHRITLVTGRVSFIVFSKSSGRGFFVIDGVPIRRLGEPRLRGEPNQIVISEEVAGVLGDTATLRPAACGAAELVELHPFPRPDPVDAQGGSAVQDPSLEWRVRPFVPKVIVDRSAYGQADWIAEFRKLTAVYVNLVGIDPTAPDVAMRVQQAVRAIAAVVNPLRIPITNILASEKGFIVQIACGMPPFAQEHNAALAVQAALRIHADLGSMGIKAAIGVTTGDAFCADIGSDSRREYVSTGLVMAYAARLMQAAINEILCDETTAHAASGAAEFSEPEQVRLKGRASPLAVHRARELALARPRFVDQLGVTFGRDAELQLLANRLSGLADGRGGIAVLEAEPGAGKTHLLAHLAGTARQSAYAVVTAATSPIEQTTAYFVFRDLLQQFIRREGDPPELPVATLRARLIELLDAHPLAPRLALLEDIVPLALADKGLAPEIKGPARLAGIEDLMVHIAAQRAAEAPMVVVIDDLQWIDGSSARVLATLLRRVPRTLSIAAMRPVDDSTTAHVKGLLSVASPIVSLPRLRREAIHAIVRERLGVPEVPSSLVDFIQTHSEGLPFFAELLLFALQDNGVVSLEGRTCRISASGLSKVSAPVSLRDLIVSRVDRLLPSPQMTIKVASAVGRVFDAETLRRVHPLTPSGPLLEQTLDQLIDAVLLSRSGDTEYPTYTFRHAIIQGVTYELLPYAQRRPLHRNIASYLETKYEGALAPHYVTLADHWERAADADRAIAFRIDAADIAGQRYANEDALNHLQHVERLVAEFGARLPKTALVRSTRIRADACQELTHFSEANGYYKKLAMLERISVPQTRVMTAIGLASESVQQTLRRAGIVRSLSQGAEQERDRLAAHIYMRFAEHAYFTNNTLGLAHGTLASL